MFNIDTAALAAQAAAKTEKEKTAFLKYLRMLHDPTGAPIHEILDQMVTDPDIETRSFVAFVLAFCD